VDSKETSTPKGVLEVLSRPSVDSRINPLTVVCGSGAFRRGVAARRLSLVLRPAAGPTEITSTPFCRPWRTGRFRYPRQPTGAGMTPVPAEDVRMALIVTAVR
jgi:hypothetical protein